MAETPLERAARITEAEGFRLVYIPTRFGTSGEVIVNGSLGPAPHGRPGTHRETIPYTIWFPDKEPGEQLIENYIARFLARPNG